jgi:tRNA U34 5-carboxymethylaminomethyl modifying GTPase MnmE/TrmE
MITNPSTEDRQATVPNLRQRKLLEQALMALKNSLHAIDCRSTSEIISETLKDAQRCLEAISGRLGDEALYDKIFEQFCVGK